MAVHFIHIRKTGGTAIKTALWRAGTPDTTHGPLRLHKHGWTLKDLRPGHHAFFCVRDPIPWFVSGFYDRLRKAQPRYFFDWTEGEREAFERFQTPAALASALADDDPAAIRAMHEIQHVNEHLHHDLGSRALLERRADQILFIARTKRLTREWPLLLRAVGLPHIQLPTDDVYAHRSPFPPAQLDDRGKAALRAWYARDYRLLKFCDELRREKGMVAVGRPSSPEGSLWARGLSRGQTIVRRASKR